MTAFDLLQDGLFAAIAAIGFSSISNTPARAYVYCAVIAAVGHALRTLLMGNSLYPIHIIVASSAAAFIIGLMAVMLAPRAKCPSETCILPALLPMIPGIYAYRTVEALILCLYHKEEHIFTHYFYLLSHNGLTCIFIVLGMVVGATVPIFMFKKISFQATR